MRAFFTLYTSICVLIEHKAQPAVYFLWNEAVAALDVKQDMNGSGRIVGIRVQETEDINVKSISNLCQGLLVRIPVAKLIVSDG